MDALVRASDPRHPEDDDISPGGVVIEIKRGLLTRLETQLDALERAVWAVDMSQVIDLSAFIDAVDTADTVTIKAESSRSPDL